MRTHRARALLMGGQARVFYGAAKFRQNTYLAIFADVVNLARLRKSLAELQVRLPDLRRIVRVDLLWQPAKQKMYGQNHQR